MKTINWQEQKDTTTITNMKPSSQVDKIFHCSRESPTRDKLYLVFDILIYIFKKKKNLKQNEAQSARAESKHKGVNQRSKYVTQVRQQRPEDVCTSGGVYVPCIHTHARWELP